MSELRDLFYNHLTLPSDKWDTYFDVYEMYYSKFKNKSPLFVEVGVQGGGSIQMWKKYFGENSRIIGIDVDPNVLDNLKYYDSTTKVYIGDQESPEFWDSFLSRNDEIDAFLDDGGHTMRQQIVTFEKVFPALKKGGVYICEDTHTSYWNSFQSELYNYNSFIEYSKRLVDIINLEHVQQKNKIDTKLIEICKDLTSVHFYDSAVVFIKNGRKEFKRVFAPRRV